MDSQEPRSTTPWFRFLILATFILAMPMGAIGARSEAPATTTMGLKMGDGDKEAIRLTDQSAFQVDPQIIRTSYASLQPLRDDDDLLPFAVYYTLVRREHHVTKNSIDRRPDAVRMEEETAVPMEEETRDAHLMNHPVSFILDRHDISLYELPRRKTLELSWSKETEVQPIIDYYDLIDAPERKGGRLPRLWCGSIPTVAESTSKTIYPAQLRCGDSTLTKGILFEIKLGKACQSGPKPREGCQYAYLYAPNKTGMFLGESLGMAVTFVDRWDEGMGDMVNRDEGFRANAAGAGFYYSLANLRTKRVRWIANVLAMDFDDEIDLELGIGTGLMFKLTEDQGKTPGFGLAAGVGYNFMVDESDEAWFTFLGLTVTIGGTKDK